MEARESEARAKWSKGPPREMRTTISRPAEYKKPIGGFTRHKPQSCTK
jgi:hypothetical protein